MPHWKFFIIFKILLLKIFVKKKALNRKNARFVILYKSIFKQILILIARDAWTIIFAFMSARALITSGPSILPDFSIFLIKPVFSVFVR